MRCGVWKGLVLGSNVWCWADYGEVVEGPNPCGRYCLCCCEVKGLISLGLLLAVKVCDRVLQLNSCFVLCYVSMSVYVGMSDMSDIPHVDMSDIPHVGMSDIPHVGMSDICTRYVMYTMICRYVGT